jgi:DNA polymerase V
MTKLFAIIDCNNFYVSCERVFKPHLENKPVVVLSNNDGCIISRSAEAKTLGIKMAEPYFKIAPLIKQHGVTAFSSNYALYGDLSSRVMGVISKFSPEVEIYSIDECFMHLSGFEHIGVEKYARTIKETVKQWTGIPVSIGIAPTKTLAKLANFVAKKNPMAEGVFCFTDKVVTERFLKTIDVSEIWGVGRKYAKMLSSHGIKTAYDFSQAPDRWIRKNMSVLGLKTAYELRGESCIELEEQSEAKKGITVSRSFSSKLTSEEQLRQAIVNFVTKAAQKLRREKKQAKHINVFIRTNHFSPMDKQYSNHLGIALPYPTDFTPDLIEAAASTLSKIFREGYLYKKAGVMLTDFYDKCDKPKDMFDIKNRIDNTNLMNALDKINAKHGSRTVFYAGSGIEQKWQPKSDLKSKCYTTSWNNILNVN